jgi:cyclase
LTYAAEGADELLLAVHSLAVDVHVALLRQLTPDLHVPVVLQSEPDSPVEAARLLEAGAARVLIQSAALADPEAIAVLSRELGKDRIGVAITARREDEVWRVLRGVGGTTTEWNAVTWAKVAEAQGVGEIVIQSAGGGAHGEPNDLDLLGWVSSIVEVPVIAIGEAHSVEDIFDAVMIGGADGVAVGSLFHSGRLSVRETKRYLSEHGLDVNDGREAHSG